MALKERIVAKTLVIGNRKFSDAETAIEIDNGLGADNPRIYVAPDEDVFRCNTTFYFMETIDVVGVSILHGAVTASTTFHGVGLATFDAGIDVSGNAIFRGNIEVQGTQTYLNTQDLLVEDKNIQVNYGGTTGGATGAGIEVLGTSNVALATFKYDPGATSKWKLGLTGAESEVMTLGHAQTATGRKQGNGFLPPGCILPYAGLSAPSDFLACDGQDYLGTDYPELYFALGTTYNTQINAALGTAFAAPAAGRFRVPDYRGLFLRGAGTTNLGIATTVGGWQDDATAKNGLTNASSAISGTTAATTTGNDSPDHSHGMAGGSMYNFRAGSFMGTATPTRDFDSGTPSTGGASARHQHSVPSVNISGAANAQVITGDTETRPQNRGVLYIIKT